MASGFTLANTIRKRMGLPPSVSLSLLFYPNFTAFRTVTPVVNGIDAIMRFYQGVRTKYPGYQWTQESMRSLDSNVVLSYEHAGSPPLRVASRCAHLFLISEREDHELGLDHVLRRAAVDVLSPLCP